MCVTVCLRYQRRVHPNTIQRSSASTMWLSRENGGGVANVLYVDDEEAIRRAVATWLRRKGHVVYTASDVASARTILQDHPIDGVFVDLWLGADSGMSLH